MDNIVSEVLASDLMAQFIQAAILAAVLVATVTLRQVASRAMDYLQQKMGREKFDEMVAFADMAVRNLEQSGLFKGLDGTQKKQNAIMHIKRRLDEIGLDMSEQDIDALIEASVHVVKTELVEPEA